MTTAAVTADALTRRDRVLTMTGVLVALLLAALDQTIVATAGPAIQRDLAIPPGLYAWITTAYLVASTVMVPIYGKLSDTYGRKPVLLVGVGLFLAGSLLCGVSPNVNVLIAARAVQGLGAASLFTTTFAVIGDLFPPQERGRYMGLIGGVMAVSSVIGPLVGGVITDTLGWHWAFLINLPVGAVAIWFILSKMPRLAGAAVRRRLDLMGAAMLVLGVVPLLVALSLGRGEEGAPAAGGTGIPLPTPLLLALSAFGLAMFVRAERRAEDPILRLGLYGTRPIGFAAAATFLVGACFLFNVIFLPLFLVNVAGVSATGAGLTMMPLTLGVVAGSVLSGQIVARTGRYKPLMLGSLALLVIAFALMAFTLDIGTTRGAVTMRMVLIGLGIGPSFPLFTLATQNAAPPSELGAVTAATTFARSLGQVVGVAVFGALFGAVVAGARGRGIGLEPALTSGVVTLYRAALVPAVLALLFTVLLPELPLAPSRPGQGAPLAD